MRVVLFVSSRIRGYGLRLPVFSKISINRRANGGATEVAISHTNMLARPKRKQPVQ